MIRGCIIISFQEINVSERYSSRFSDLLTSVGKRKDQLTSKITGRKYRQATIDEAGVVELMEKSLDEHVSLFDLREKYYQLNPEKLKISQ